MILKKYVRNRNRPEGCMAENYIAEEAIEFCSEYLSGLDAVGVPTSRNMTKEKDKDNTISDGKPIGGITVGDVDDNDLERAHLYVLENTDDVLPYIE